MDEGFVGLIFSVFNHDKASKVKCKYYKQHCIMIIFFKVKLRTLVYSVSSECTELHSLHFALGMVSMTCKVVAHVCVSV